MIDTINYKIDLLVNGQDSIKTLCHVIIRDTNDACCTNAIPITGIICGACVLIVAFIIWWKCAHEKHLIDGKKEENKKRQEERMIERYVDFLEELSKNGSKLRDIGGNPSEKLVAFMEQLTGVKEPCGEKSQVNEDNK